MTKAQQLIDLCEAKTITILFNTEYNEYRAPGPKGTEAQAIYTDDKEDAIGSLIADWKLAGIEVTRDMIKFKKVDEWPAGFGESKNEGGKLSPNGKALKGVDEKPFYDEGQADAKAGKPKNPKYSQATTGGFAYLSGYADAKGQSFPPNKNKAEALLALTEASKKIKANGKTFTPEEAQAEILFFQIAIDKTNSTAMKSEYINKLNNLIKAVEDIS